MDSSLLDFASVILPFLISLLGVHMSTSLSKKQKGILIGAGILVSALTWIQQQESRKSHEVEIKTQTDKIEQLRTSLETARISGESGQSYLRGQLDSVNRTLGGVLANSDPKQLAVLLRGVATDKSTLKKRTLVLCSDIESWFKKQPPIPPTAVPGKPTQKELEDQNTYAMKINNDYFQRFGIRALGMIQEYGAKGFDVRMMEQTAQYGYLPNNLCTQLRAFANRLNDDGTMKQ
ncbi:MAG: hypothetical protein ACHQT6_12680 [Candidatus Acidiferrales bacterium]